MKPIKGYYSLIQFCPDQSRLEAANVGVVLFCPELDFLEVRISGDNARIQKFFGKQAFDWSRVNSYKHGIKERLEIEGKDFRNVEDLNAFGQRRTLQLPAGEGRAELTFHAADARLAEVGREVVAVQRDQLVDAGLVGVQRPVPRIQPLAQAQLGAARLLRFQFGVAAAVRVIQIIEGRRVERAAVAGGQAQAVVKVVAPRGRAGVVVAELAVVIASRR